MGKDKIKAGQKKGQKKGKHAAVADFGPRSLKNNSPSDPQTSTATRQNLMESNAGHKDVDNDPSKSSDYDYHKVPFRTFMELPFVFMIARVLNRGLVARQIQAAAMPRIVSGQNVVVRAKSGSGKTFGYVFFLLQELWMISKSKGESFASSYLSPLAIVLLPTVESCQQVYQELESWTNKFVPKLEDFSLSLTLDSSARIPNILISSPRRLLSYLSKGFIKIEALEVSMKYLILDEADVLMSPSYEKDLKALIPQMPKSSQRLLFFSNPSANVEKLENLGVHNPCVVVTLAEEGTIKKELAPYNVEQFYIACDEDDKLPCISEFIRSTGILVRKKILIFTNSMDRSLQLQRLFAKCGESAEVISYIPKRKLIIEKFNAGAYKFLIVTDDNQLRRNGDGMCEMLYLESGAVLNGIDLKDVYDVVQFDMPLSVGGYVGRIVCAGRSNKRLLGRCYSLVSPKEMDILEAIKSYLGEHSIFQRTDYWHEKSYLEYHREEYKELFL